MSSAEKIVANSAKITSFVDMVQDDNMKRLFRVFEERFATAPASARADFFSAYPGGLAHHTLNVLKNMSAVSSAFGTIDKKSMIRVGLLHEFGKVGTRAHEYYIPQKSEWHKDRGVLYEINPEISFMRIPHRSLFLAQQFSIQLTQDEHLAILLFEGQLAESNAPYKYREPDLATLLQVSSQLAITQEKKEAVNTSRKDGI